MHRSNDPRVVEARAAIEAGQLDLARSLVDQAAALAGTEGPLLRARLAAMESDDFEVRRFLEEARRLDPADPRIYSTAAELAAAEGRLDEADREIQRGLEVCGAISPELLRARGIHLICSAGHAREGLEFLDRALERDPDLPFMGRPLGQAHLLVGKERMASGDPQGALEEATLSLQFDPEDLPARRFQAECLMAVGEWGRGIGVYELLLTEGLPLQAELATYCKNAGFWASTHGERGLALRYYRRALELGLPHDQLGSGAAFLVDESAIRVEDAMTLLAADDAEGALEAVEDALLLDPNSVLVWYAKGHAHHARGEFELTEIAWARVVSSARSDGIDLPEPVHLSLARVQALGLGNYEAARNTLEAYLVLEPAGAWVEETRTLLQKLPVEAPPEEDDGSPGD